MAGQQQPRSERERELDRAVAEKAEATIAGFVVLDDYPENGKIPDGSIVVSSTNGWQNTTATPTTPRNELEARQLQRTAQWAFTQPRRHAWAAVAWKVIRRFRGDSRTLHRPDWRSRRTSARPRARGARRRRGPPRKADESDCHATSEVCSWR